MLKAALAGTAALGVLLALMPAPVAAQSASEDQLKVAFLYNFARFSQWPDGSFTHEDSPFVLGVIGTVSFAEALEVIQQKSIHGRPVEIRVLDEPTQLEGCHLLFVGASEKARLPEILQLAREWNVLTVAEMRDFASSGGVINFTRKARKVGFQINVAAAKQIGVKLGSELLKRAEILNTSVGQDSAR